MLAAALAAVGSGAIGFWKGFALIGAAIPAALMARVVFEGNRFAMFLRSQFVFA